MFIQLLTVQFEKHNKIYKNWFHYNLLLTFYVQDSCHKTQFEKLLQAENNLKTSFSRKLINFFKVNYRQYYKLEHSKMLKENIFCVVCSILVSQIHFLKSK